MNLRQNINHYKVLLHQGADLLLLRLRILGLDLNDQATTILKIIAAIVFAGALFSFGMISRLFGLDSALGAEAKIWVFFGIALACLLGIAALAAWIMSSWQQKKPPNCRYFARYAARYRLSARAAGHSQAQ